MSTNRRISFGLMGLVAAVAFAFPLGAVAARTFHAAPAVVAARGEPKNEWPFTRRIESFGERRALASPVHVARRAAPTMRRD